MSRLIGFCRSFYKNVIVKRKFKAFFMFLFDSEYRGAIERVYKASKGRKVTETREIEFRCIKQSHKIVYPDYAYILMRDEAREIPPIKVTLICQDKAQRQVYLVVDGNHRLPALMARAKKQGKTTILCEVMT